MRCPAIPVIALLGLACGCAGIEIVARPPPQFLAVQTWSDVAEDETEVTTSAGHALHLPVIPASDGRELDFDAWRVTVNGTPTHLERHEAYSGQVSYVFRPEKAGSYQVEVRWAQSGDLIHVWKITATE